MGPTSLGGTPNVPATADVMDATGNTNAANAPPEFLASSLEIENLESGPEFWASSLGSDSSKFVTTGLRVSYYTSMPQEPPRHLEGLLLQYLIVVLEVAEVEISVPVVLHTLMKAH